MANFLAYRVMNGHLDFNQIPNGKIKEEVRLILIQEGYENLTK